MNSTHVGSHTAHDLPKMTRNQGLVFETLSAEAGPMTAYAILDALRSEGFKAPLQVYRALDKLVEFGIVHRLESLNAFVACSHPGCGKNETAAFAICETCGGVDEFTPEKAVECLQAWADTTGFSPSRTTIELRGTCRDCRTAA